MKIGFIDSKDLRCPISEVSLKKLQQHGAEVLIDEAFSKNFSSVDRFYKKAEIIQESDILVSLDPLSEIDHKSLKSGARVLSIYESYMPGFELENHGRSDVSMYSMDMIPRSTLAQSMDILSSMASISGYKAVLLAAYKLPRFFPMMMTAAGTIRPANILIIGAGVAGLQAIATARKLGARVEAFDVRAAVKEEVQSLGAKFVEVEGAKDEKTAGGYAVEQTEQFLINQKQAIANSVEKADVVITTAQLRGKKAPLLVTNEMVQRMKSGSVIIDIASSTGGNVEPSVDGKEIQYNDVTIIGNSSLFLDCLADSSEMIANNFMNFLKLFSKDDNGINASHEILEASKIYPKN